MKKLMMFAAAMTIVGGAFADCGETATNNCALVYDVTVSLKTTLPKSGSVTTSVSCSDVTGVICYRVPGTMALKGFYTACACDCDSFLGGTLTLWNPKAKALATEGLMNWTVFNLIGKTETDIEALWSMVDATDGTGLSGAGFGKWDAKADRVSSISGDVVGKLLPPECQVSGCPAAVAFPCSETQEDSIGFTIAYGTWSMKYNATQSKKLATTGDGSLSWPSYL